MSMRDGHADGVVLCADQVATLQQLLVDSILPAESDISADTERVELLSALESVKNTAAALQAQLAVDLDRSVRAQHARAGAPTERQGQGVAAQVALGRRESPNRGQQLLGLAKDLVRDLPHTFAAMRSGALSEYRAMVVARESGCLDRDDRLHLDAELFAAKADASLSSGTRQLASSARQITYRLDPAATARRSSQATADRRVSLRPAPDTMTYLTALLPVAQGVAAFATLTREAAARRAAGDPRSKGQLMADLLVERTLGQLTSGTNAKAQEGAAQTSSDTSSSDPASDMPVVPLTLDLVISDQTLLGGGHEPAFLQAAGVPAIPLPAQHARELAADALASPLRSWIRRLYADPGGSLISMTRRQRFVCDGLADFLRIRDRGICRTPWCDAPVTESDHVRPVSHDGTTDDVNTQGCCTACNHAKQAAGWIQTTVDQPEHTVETITPTGHRYRSVAPTQPTPPPAPAASDRAA